MKDKSTYGYITVREYDISPGDHPNPSYRHYPQDFPSNEFFTLSMAMSTSNLSSSIYAYSI